MRLMRHVATFAALTLLAGCIEARTEVATITLDYLTSAQAMALAEPYLSPDGRLMTSDATLNTFTVRDRRDNVRRIRSLVNERDASPQNVSLHFQVVRATETGAVDPQLARVSGALRELLRFEGYELVAQAVVSASERRVVEQSLSGGAFPLQLGVRINDIAGGSGSVDMQVDLRREGYASLLATNVVVPMGQTVVLGSAYPGTSGEALILTVRGERGSMKLRSSTRRNEADVEAAAAARGNAVIGTAVDEELARRRAGQGFDGVMHKTLGGSTKSAVLSKSHGGDAARVATPAARADGPSPTRARAKAGAPPEGDR